MYPPSGYGYFKSPRKRSDNHDRGVAVLIRKDTHHKPLPLNTVLQAVAARLWMGKWYTVCSLYLPHLPLQLTDLEHLINQLPPPFLLLGDMNARSALWEEPTTRTDQRGRIVESLLTRTDVALLNTAGVKTHADMGRGVETTIDLALCSPQCLVDFSHEVLEDRHGSDHYPIQIRHNTPALEYNYPQRYKIEKADWARYRQLTRSNSDLGEEGDPEGTLLRICNKITEAADACIPRTTGSRRKIPMPWWNHDCQIAIVAKRRAQNAMRRNPNILEHKISYKRNRAIARSTLNKAKREHWRKHVSSINSQSNTQTMWKKIKKMNGKFSPPRLPLLKTSTGTLVQDPNETSNIFAQAFSSVSSSENYSAPFKRYKIREERKRLNFDTEEDLEYNRPFSHNEFKQALSLTSESSPGIDRISYTMIKKSHPTLRDGILRLTNRLFLGNLFPTDWGTAIIIPIERAEKEHTEALSSRPVSLTNCLCKLMEGMVNPRLMWILEKLGVIEPNQSGFRKNRSTTDCLVKFQNDIREAISRREHTIAVFFDLTKAYDMAWRHGILMELHRIGLRGNLPKFVSNFLSNRRICVRVGNVLSETLPIEEGTPQGSVISCTLFMVAINQIAKNLPPDVTASLYVDDFAIYAYGQRISGVERRLQLAINGLQAWSERTGFVFSTTKTVVMHICRRNGCQRTTGNLALNGTLIPAARTHTFLGLKIDQRLSWRAHITDLKKSCCKVLDLLKYLSHKTWGSDTKTLLRIVIALLKPKIDYGVEAYGQARESLLRMLDPILNQAIRIATGAFRSSPIPSLLTISGLKPLSTYREIKTLNYLLRATVTKSNPLNAHIHGDLESFGEPSDDEREDLPSPARGGTFLDKSRELTRKYNLSPTIVQSEEIPASPPWMEGDLSICTELDNVQKNQYPEAALRRIFSNHLLDHRNSKILYTDGSKTENGVAFAVVGDGDAVSHRISGLASVFTAELLAILQAVKQARTDYTESVTIITDSKSSIQAITKLYQSNPIVNQIKNEIYDSKKSVKLCWVPSHIGVGGNEEADLKAREATCHPDITQIPLPRSDLKCYIKKKARLFCERGWQQESLQNKLRKITDTTAPLPNSSCSNREWERGLVRLRIGHCLLTHGHLMDRGRPPECVDCDQPLTIEHIITECPNFENKRRFYFPNYRPTMKFFLKEADTSYRGPLYSFVKEIGLLDKL